MMLLLFSLFVVVIVIIADEDGDDGCVAFLFFGAPSYLCARSVFFYFMVKVTTHADMDERKHRLIVCVWKCSRSSSSTNGKNFV